MLSSLQRPHGAAAPVPSRQSRSLVARTARSIRIGRPRPAAAAPGQQAAAARRRDARARGLVPWTEAMTAEPEMAFDAPFAAPTGTTSAKAAEPDPEFPMGLSFFADGASFSVWAPHARSATLEVAEELITTDSSSGPPANNNNNNDGTGSEPVVAKGVKTYPLVRMGDNWATVLQPGQIKSGQAYRLMLTVLDETRPIESSGGGGQNVTGAMMAQASRPPPVQTDFIPSAGSQAWDMSTFQQQQQQQQQQQYQQQPTSYSAYNPYGNSGGSSSNDNPYGASSNPYGASSNPYGASSNPYGASSNPYASAPVVQYHEKKVKRRDPYALSAHYNSAWCYAFDPSGFAWDDVEFKTPPQDEAVIYQLHIGSFTPEGTIQAAARKLPHVASMGFTMIQLLPCAEFSDPAKWGYNPRQLMALHQAYGTPQDMCEFVNLAHTFGMGVMMDVVLHHGAPAANNLWDYDGWTNGEAAGGIYHENAHDTNWGKAWAFWKKEVADMLYDACASWLSVYKMDGLRFDSAAELPVDLMQRITWQLREKFPGKLLTADLTPEDPNLMKQYGFDAIWVRNFYDIVHQHREFGRSQHVSNDSGWDLDRLGAAMRSHWGFESPNAAVKFMTGCHDQVGCQRNGGFYEECRDIGGQKRYAVDSFCGSRGEPKAMAAVRLWYAANVGAAGIPLLFQGTEVLQGGWWNADEWHGFNWEFAGDQMGIMMMNCVRTLHMLRRKYPALRQGWANCIHEDRMNGIMGYERVVEGEERIVVVVNAGQQHWQRNEYGVWVGGGGIFQEIFCSQDADFGGFCRYNPAYGESTFHSNPLDIKVGDGRINISIPPQCTLFFRQKSI